MAEPTGGAAALRACKKDIAQGSLAGAVLLFGREDYLIRSAREALLDAYIEPAVKELDLTRMDPGTFTLSSLIEQCETLPVFSKKRIVLVPDFPPLEGKTLKGFGEKDEQELFKYLQTMPETTLLVFTTRKADKRTKLFKAIPHTYEFGPVERGVLERFAEKTLEPFGKTMEPAAFRLLVEQTGYYPDEMHKTASREYEYTLDHLENDLKKLAAGCEAATVTREDVRALVGNNLELDVFRIMDSAASGEKGEALLQLRGLLRNGESVYKLLGLFVSQLEILLAVRKMREDSFPQSEMVKQLGVHEFRVKKAVPLANRFSEEKLRKAMRFALEIDGSIKRGELEGPVALELLLAQL